MFVETSIIALWVCMQSAYTALSRAQQSHDSYYPVSQGRWRTTSLRLVAEASRFKLTSCSGLCHRGFDYRSLRPHMLRPEGATYTRPSGKRAYGHTGRGNRYLSTALDSPSTEGSVSWCIVRLLSPSVPASIDPAWLRLVRECRKKWNG